MYTLNIIYDIINFSETLGKLALKFQSGQI